LRNGSRDRGCAAGEFVLLPLCYRAGGFFDFSTIFDSQTPRQNANQRLE